MNGKFLMALAVPWVMSSQVYAGGKDDKVDLQIVGGSLAPRGAFGSRRARTPQPQDIPSPKSLTFNNLVDFTSDVETLPSSKPVTLNFKVVLESIAPICRYLERANVEKLIISDPDFSDEAAEALAANFPKSIKYLIVFSDKLSPEGKDCLQGLTRKTLIQPEKIPASASEAGKTPAH